MYTTNAAQIKIRITYLDKSSEGSFAVHHINAEGTATISTSVATFDGSQEWLTAEVTLEDVRLTTLFRGCHFRIQVSQNAELIVHKVELLELVLAE